MFRRFVERWVWPRRLSASADDWPEALQRYMAARSPVDKTMRVREARFVVFDSETSGLDLSTNHVLSIAGVAVHGHDVRLDDAFEAVVSHHDVGGAEAAVVHGMIRDDLVDGVAEDEAAAQFLAFAGDAVLVAHHAAFDIRMLQKAIAPHRGAKVWNPIVDTGRLARRVDDDAQSSGQYALDSLVESYDIDIADRHTAAGDALATALLLQKLLKRAEQRGIVTLGDLLARRRADSLW